jgi:hypothetical protein
MGAILTAIWGAMNGKKMDTGTIVTIMAIVLQHFGASQGEALTMSTDIMMGMGGVILVIGFIHRLIKAKQAGQPAGN